jgi:hypothetical protein
MNDTLTLNPRGFTAMSRDEMMAVDGGWNIGQFFVGIIEVVGGVAMVIGGLGLSATPLAPSGYVAAGGGVVVAGKGVYNIISSFG